jgi:hypothetical protein
MTNAAQFNGTGERLTRSTGPSPNAAYTVAFWSRVDSYKSTDYQTLFTFLMSGSEWETIMLDSSNRLVIEAGVSGSGSRVNAASAFGTGTWKYIALVRASTTSLKAYVDGTEVLSLTTNISARSAAVTEFAFGSDTYTEDSNSSVAYARAWSAALNTTELAAEKDSATAVRTANLYDSWEMQANGNGVNGNNLSAVGTVSYVTTGPTLSTGINGTLTKTLGTLTSTATGTVALAGTLTKTLGALTSTAAGTVALAGTLAKTLGALTSAATGTLGSSPITGTLSKTLGALTASATGKLAIAGTLAKTLGALAVAAKGYHLESATTGGLLEVDSTNPRYFSVGGAIKVLSGFHTWETLVDHGAAYPPSAFDYTAYLDAAAAKGTNFVKLWAMESLRDWCDISILFYPPVYERTGPGNAADGRPKVDLTKFNPVYMERLRERAIEAGNRGMYVCVQLFQGWQITQKGYTAGAPGTYHPFNAANNINSIDGDTDNDGQVGETRDISWTAVYDLQKAYVRAVIDAVNDLDHVIYEISNEEDEVDNAAGHTKVEWQHALIDYIHTYEAGKAKQHPVGMTVQFPAGSDSDLFASNADWISPKDGSVITSVTASDGSKVILWDTDHTVGLTDEHEWTWLAFCRGCSPLYMDEWDGGLYGTDKRLLTANERIRANLGYILDYAARIDLANATPNGSLSSTGYALAKTSGIVQILAYQNASGAFTVNLTSFSGTFTVEWLRTSTGATQAGSDVSGGAVRTLTPPWASEDVVAFLELTGMEGVLSKTLGSLTSAAAGTLALAGTLAKTLGALTSNATGVVAIVGTASKTLGALTVASTATLAIAGTVNATLGALTSTAAGTVAIVGTASATLGSLTVVATGQLTSGPTGELTGTLGALTATSTGALAIAGTGALTLGNLTATATGVLSIVGTAANTLGSLTVTASGALSSGPTGEVAATLGSLTSEATGVLALAGSVDAALGSLTSAATGALANNGTVAVTLGALTMAGSGVAVLIIATVAGSVRGPRASGTVYGAKTNGSIGG